MCVGWGGGWRGGGWDREGRVVRRFEGQVRFKSLLLALILKYSFKQPFLLWVFYSVLTRGKFCTCQSFYVGWVKYRNILL